MSYQYSPEQLRDLNEQAYRANPKEPVLNGKVSSPLNKGDTITGKQSYEVVDITYDKDTGFKGLALAPIINGKPNYSAIVVVAAGTAPDIKQPDLGAAVREIMSTGSSQIKHASTFVSKVQKEIKTVDGKVSQLSGYSQSGYMIKIGAEKKIPVTTFNEFFDYSTLSDEEKEYIENNSNFFISFKNLNDPVVGFNDQMKHGLIGDKEEVGTVVVIQGVGGMAGHSLTSWKFDKNGDVLDENGKVILKIADLHLSKMQEKQLKKIDKKLSSILNIKSSLSSATGSQKIFLQTELVFAVAKQMIKNAETQKETASLEIKKLQHEAKEAKQDYVQKIVNATHLTQLEALNLYAICAGSNDYNEELYTNKIQMINEFYDKKILLANKINKWALNKIEHDKELTKLFK